MKHGKIGRKLHRVRNQRKALFRTLLTSLIMHEKMETTEAKAKEVKDKIDRIVNKAKKISATSNKGSILEDIKNSTSVTAAKKLNSDFIKKFSSRNSGYTRIIKLSPRKKDGAKMAIIEFVD